MAGTKSVTTRLVANGIVACGLVFCVASASAQNLSRYRTYDLESSVAAVVAASGARAEDAKTLHNRPARIQEMSWRAPYVYLGSELADPVRLVAFSFFNDALYQVVVSYDRDRTQGLTDRDIIESLAATYGAPVLSSPSARTRATVERPEVLVLARWEDEASSVTLVRNIYSPEYELLLISKSLNARAQKAIREAIQLEALEAPRRELEQRQKASAEEDAAKDKTRSTNHRAFRP